MIWHRQVSRRLRASGLFCEVRLVGAKVRAAVDRARFLDVHYDPTTSSYSYALIDLRLSWPGDKRLFGWDDYPHESIARIKALPTYPHHYQRRLDDGSWLYEPSPMRGRVDEDMDALLRAVNAYLRP